MRTLRRGAIGLVVGAVIGALAALTPAAAMRAQPAAEQAAAVSAAGPEEALRLAVEAAGGVYAGDCDATVAPRDIGKTCSRFVAERDGTRAYLTGRAFSEFTTWLFVAPRADGRWQVTGSAPLDFFGPPEPPWP